MSISTAKLDTLYRIASFLGEPAPGCSKQFQFAQLARDFLLLRQLKEMNLPLFSFLNQREITPIDQSQGLVAELDRIRAIFRDIHVAAKNNLTAAQFNQICAQNGTRTLSRYIQLSVAHQANQDHAVTVLADTLRDQIPAIPNTPVEIRAWFANPANQEALQRITFLYMDKKQLKCLPDEIGLLVNLRKLSLSSNQLRALPETFGDLVNLQNLYLFNNQLRALPETFGNLVKLQFLYLSNNQLTALPETFGDLVDLIELTLSSNQLRALPETFGKLLVDLHILNLRNNKLFDLPKSIKSFFQEKGLQMGTQRIDEGVTSDDGIGIGIGGGGGGAAAND